MDNCPIHHGKRAKAYFAQKNIPVQYTAPASFRAIPVEMTFAEVKKNFAKLMEEEVELKEFKGTKLHKTSEKICAQIVMAVV